MFFISERNLETLKNDRPTACRLRGAVLKVSGKTPCAYREIVQEESRRLGVPNVYSINGTLYYEHLDGTLTTDDPYGQAPA